MKDAIKEWLGEPLWENWKPILSLCMIVVGSFGAGWAAGWGAKTYFENREENRELVQLDRKVEELKKTNSKLTSDKQQLQERLKTFSDTRLPNQIAPLDTVPSFDEAVLDETTAKDMGAKWFTYQAKHPDKTTINLPPFYNKFATRKFKWKGVLVDVVNNGAENCAVLQVEAHRTLPEDFQEDNGVPRVHAIQRLAPYTFRCYFLGDEHERQLKKLQRQNHTLTVTGVMDEYGNLRRCKIDQITDGVPKFDWMMAMNQP